MARRTGALCESILGRMLLSLAAVLVAYSMAPGIFYGAALAIGSALGLPTAEESVGEALCIIASPNDWEAASKEERIELLQVVVDAEAQHLGIWAPQLKAGSLSELSLVMACYDGVSNEITYDTYYLANRPGFDAVETCCHEVYHGFQQSVCKGLADEPLPGARKRWQSEFDNYVSAAGGSDAYRQQDVEVTARAYAKQRVAAYREKAKESAA